MNAAGFSLIIILFVSTLVSASSLHLPDLYVGKAYLNGAVAPEGTNITVKSHSTGELLGKGAVYADGLTKVKVVFDNDFEEGVDEGADPDEALDWYMAGVLASTPAAGSLSASPGDVHTDFILKADSGGKTSLASLIGSQTLDILVLLAALILAFLFFKAIFILVKR